MKKDEIYRKLRQDIISGILKEGDKLPTEFECAALFHVSRDTIRESLKLLENDGFIERVKAKGTFVKIPKVGTGDRSISFLVPCYEYLRHTNIHSMNLMFELIAQAAVAGWHITPVIYSKTNDPNDIWWDNLSHIHTNSRVIINHSWFKPYFETLAAIGARVAYIDNDWEQQQEISSYTENWISFIEQDRVAAGKAFQYLQAKGCRKIAVFMPNPSVQTNTIAEEYRKFAKQTGQDELLFPIIRDSGREIPPEFSLNQIKEIAEKSHFDGLLIHADEFLLPVNGSFRSVLGLSADFPIVAIPTQSEQFYSVPNEEIPIVHYPVEEMARDMIRHLTAGQYIKQKCFYEPTIMLCGKEIKN